MVEFDLLAGLVGGLVATVVMSLMMSLAKSAGMTRMPPMLLVSGSMLSGGPSPSGAARWCLTHRVCWEGTGAR